MRKIYLVLVFICFLFSASAQIDSMKMEQYLNLLDKHEKAMISVCLSHDGKLEFQKAIGFVDVANNLKSNVFSLYHIGSITKMFTSVMIFQLIDEKKLTLETKLNKYFPSIPNSEKITISNLLNHRSGIHNFTDDSLYESILSRPHSESDLISMFEKNASDFEPNSKAEYSNTNYVLLTFIIEKITKSTYAKELQKRIAFKAGLTDTKVGSKINTSENVAQSYTYVEGNWTKATETDMSIPRGAGAIISTAKDLCKFIESLFEGKLMSKESFELMKAMENNYGRGIFIFPFGEKKSYGHTGGIDGFQSMLGYFPEDKLAFCMLGNGYNYSMNDIALGILKIYFNKPFELPSFEKRELSKEVLQAYQGQYSNNSIKMTLTISKDNDKLFAQASGQGMFPLEKISDTEYHFDQGGIIIIFNKDSEGNIPSLTIKQAGQNLTFEKE